MALAAAGSIAQHHRQGDRAVLAAQHAADTAGGALALRANTIVIRALGAAGTTRGFTLRTG